AREILKGVADIGFGGLGRQLDGNGYSVAVDDGNAIAVRAHPGRQRLDVIAGEGAEDLLRLLLHLLLFAADIRDHVGVDVHGRDDQLGRAVAGLAIVHELVGDVGRCSTVEPPSTGVAILLAGGTIARSKPGYVKPGMAL